MSFSRAHKTRLALWWWSIDRRLLNALVLLLLCGFVLSFAASPSVAERIGLSPWHFVIRHGAFCVLSIAVMLGTSFLTHTQVRMFALVLLTFSFAMLAATVLFGEEVKGARRWISLVGFSLQPSEFIKPASAVVAAWLVSEAMRDSSLPGRWLAALIMLAIAVFLLLQPDIGQTALVLATWATLLFISGISWWLVLGLAGVGAALLTAAYVFFPHFARRIDAFLGSGDSSASYQVERAAEAFAEGGWFGMGPGESASKGRIPDAHADYVLAAAAGEFGIIFCIALVALLAWIPINAMMRALRQQNEFVRLAGAALAAQFAMQSGIHLVVNAGLAPTKGMTLPFVSYGGTSMLAVAFGMGLLLALTRVAPESHFPSALPFRPLDSAI